MRIAGGVKGHRWRLRRSNMGWAGGCECGVIFRGPSRDQARLKANVHALNLLGVSRRPNGALWT